MMRALYSSVSGLKTHQTKMDVIGNNIANVNTVGFKSSRTTFSTMMYQTTTFASGANAEMGKGGVNAKQIGLGTNFASTAIDIETGGANESTGKAFDLKLSDTNTTSFYIVNTGTENVFTRAGAFYVDGAGNLCMESTGYTVMGWQVDANGNIRKDTVSPLKIMSAENQTSNPEYTTRATCSGILDDNNSNVNSDSGYAMNLNFFDNLGYAYTATFAAQKTGGDGEYTINLTDIIDNNEKSIISGTNVKLSDLFGTASGQGSKVDITDSYKMASGMSNVLKRLAMTPVLPAGSTDVNTSELTYTFTAAKVNELLGSKVNKLPDGYTVEYTRIGNPSAVPPTYTYRTVVKDSSGAVVTDLSDYAGDQTATPPVAGWLAAAADGSTAATSANDTGMEFIKKVTVEDKIREFYDASTMELVSTDAATGAKKYKLSAQNLIDLQNTFQLTGTTSVSGDITVEINDLVSPMTITNLDVTQAAGTAFAAVTLADTREYKLSDAENIGHGYLNVNAKDVNDAGIFTTDLPIDAEVHYFEEGGRVVITTPATDGFKAQFSTADGSLTYIGSAGNTTQTLRLSNYILEGDNPIQFTDIQIDFSTLKNLANGASCTAAMAPGNDGEGDGKKVGTMIGLSVDTSGKVWGSYSNGNTALLGQIAVARFANASGLESIGDNCFRTTMNSGEFDGIGVEMDSDGSTIDSGTLEMSNVDLATEFTQMITTQRGYQANSRVISTSDSILEELVNLKR